MRLIPILFLLSISISSTAQSLRGKIKDQEGDPVAYATVYIQELRQGTTSNTKGDYEIKIPSGKYTVVYQSLGYAPELRNITISTEARVLDITLQVQYYEIPEVRITASGEDPAYGIMRKVIGMAPYYLNQVESYRAEVYLKGNLVIKKIPKLLQRSINAEARSSTGNSYSSRTMKEGDTYMMESFNEIDFRAPDKYVQKVISSRSTFPETGNDISPMDFIQASFYEPVINDMFISPLSPDAFFHYKFRYDGLSVQGNDIINKIEVIPKRKSQQLFSGVIYIVEDLWCLHSVDLVNDNIAGKVRVQQICIPVLDKVWLPVSHKFEVNISIVGVKADAGYGGSIKYLEVKENMSIQKPSALQAALKKGGNTGKAESDTTRTKTDKQIEKILSKNELSNRDMVKLSGLLDKQARESRPDSLKNNLEIKENTTYIIEKDANKKDSTFWAEIRPIPLSENEVRSIHVSDSIAGVLKIKKETGDTLAKPVSNSRKFLSALRVIGYGHTWADTSGTRFYFGGLMKIRNFGFNTVDGFTYGINFSLYKKFEKGSLDISPELRYAFSRNTLMWRINMQYTIPSADPTRLYVRAGMMSRDISNAGGISPVLNMFTSLLMRNNYLKLYDSRFVTTGIGRELVNGLRAELSAGYEDRRILDNNTDFAFIGRTKRQYTGNTPVNPYLVNPYFANYQLEDQTHVEFTARLIYIPRQKFMIQKGTKIPQGSDYPTFSLQWKHGMNRLSGSDGGYTHFDKIRFEASQRKSIGAFSSLRWNFRTGYVFNKENLSFIDFNHFNSQPLTLLFNDYDDAFMLPRFYSLSTPEYYTEFHCKFTTPYLLVKLLPVLSNTLMRENLSASWLWSRYNTAYTEIGYSISEVFLLGEAGVYAGFDNFNFSSAGFRLILKIGN